MNNAISIPNMVRSCIAYRLGQRVGDIPIEDISEVVKQENTFIWVSLHEPDAALLRKMQEEFGLHELAIEDARSAHQRPKLEQYGNSLFIVLKTAMLTDDHVALGETHMFVGPHFLVTVRHGPSISYSKVREHLESTPEQLAKGPAMAVYAVMDFIVDNYRPIVDAMQEKFDRLEEDIFSGEFKRDTLEGMYDLKRELLVLRGGAAPILDITDSLMRFHEELVHKDLRVYYRDIHDHVIRVIATTDEIREMLTAAMQVNLAFVSVEQNEAVKKMAGWGAVLAVPTVVFSLYGMNFKQMPELEWGLGYPVVLGLTMAGGVWLYRRLKHFGWL